MDRIKSLYHGDPELPLQSVAEKLSVCDWSVSMRVKKVLADVRLAVAEIEVSWNGTLRSSATLCAIVNNDRDGGMHPENETRKQGTVLEGEN